jgi:hypothetical protein
MSLLYLGGAAERGVVPILPSFLTAKKSREFGRTDAIASMFTVARM